MAPANMLSQPPAGPPLGSGMDRTVALRALPGPAPSSIVVPERAAGTPEVLALTHRGYGLVAARQVATEDLENKIKRERLGVIAQSSSPPATPHGAGAARSGGTRPGPPRDAPV